MNKSSWPIIGYCGRPISQSLAGKLFHNDESARRMEYKSHFTLSARVPRRMTAFERVIYKRLNAWRH
jgi:hypothetical protein